MSLQTLANHMAAQGRGPDSTLVHMSPREVQGLQALAMAHGGSLTINPQTGLPEAGFLDSLLPAIAGFALDAFLPGLGEGVGGMLGLSGSAATTAGTGLLVGGATGLATGSLEKGLMAGLGAYGGANLGEAAFGASAAGQEAAKAAADTAIAKSPAGALDRLNSIKEGAGILMSAPDALKNNAWNLGLAAAPGLAGTFDDQTSSAAKIHPGYIRGYEKDPVTGALYQVSATPADQYTGGITFGGVSAPTKYGASGGLMQHYDDGGTTEADKKSITFGGVGLPDLSGVNMDNSAPDSQRVQDYLMGIGPNPYLFYHKTGQSPIEKAAEATSEIAKVIEEQKRGGSGKSYEDSGNTGNNYTGVTPSFWGGVTNLGLMAANSGIPGLVWAGDKALAAAEDAKGNTALSRNTVQDPAQKQQAIVQNMANQYSMYNNPNYGVQDAINKTDFSGMDRGSTSNAPSTPDTQAVRDAINKTDFSGMDRGSTSNESSGRDPSGEAHDSRDARGGFLNNGRFDQRYAYGGIAALADGGMYNLGSYSDGGRLLRGPGDGVSDDIPATIGHNQPARLADGEFVVPARIVSELGNGSTEAGARKLYAMMDRVQKARTKTVGKDKVAANSRADKYLPA